MTNDPDTLALQLRYSDFDDQGVLNNAVYLSLFELGRVNYVIRRVPHSELKLRLLVAHIEVDYLKPVTFGAKLSCRSSVASTGNTSVTFSQELFFTESGEVAARARCIAVAIDREGNKQPVPEIFKLESGRKE